MHACASLGTWDFEEEGYRYSARTCLSSPLIECVHSPTSMACLRISYCNSKPEIRYKCSDFITVPNSMNSKWCRWQQFISRTCADGVKDNNEAQVCRLSPYCIKCGDTCDVVIICDTCSPHTGSDGRYAILPPLLFLNHNEQCALLTALYYITMWMCRSRSGAAVVRCTQRRWQHCVLFVRETPLLSARFLFPLFWLLRFVTDFDVRVQFI